jgi:hypothetical protein
VSPEPCASGDFLRPGQVTVIAAHPSGLLSTAESALLAGVRAPTIRQWRRLGYLAAQGLDEHGYPMHSAEAVRDAERRVRENAIAKGHFDPRRTRKTARAA